MRRMMIFAVGIVIALSAGCAKQMTRDDVLRQQVIVNNAQTKIYDEKPAVILKAAEQVLYAADRDYQALPEQSETVYTSKRSYFFTLVLNTVIGEDFWKVTAVPREDGKTVVKATSWIGSRSVGMFPMSAASPGDINNCYMSAPLYRLFFERLDYVLGKRDVWTKCSEASTWIKDEEFPNYDGLTPLCTFVDDKVAERVK